MSPPPSHSLYMLYRRGSGEKDKTARPQARGLGSDHSLPSTDSTLPLIKTQLSSTEHHTTTRQTVMKNLRWIINQTWFLWSPLFLPFWDDSSESSLPFCSGDLDVLHHQKPLDTRSLILHHQISPPLHLHRSILPCCDSELHPFSPLRQSACYHSCRVACPAPLHKAKWTWCCININKYRCMYSYTHVCVYITLYGGGVGWIHQWTHASPELFWAEGFLLMYSQTQSFPNLCLLPSVPESCVIRATWPFTSSSK